MYFTAEDELKQLHIQIPKALLYEEKYTEGKNKLSSDAKILYGFFLDRVSLSMRNKWVDEGGKLYFLCDQISMARILGCSEKKARQIKKELISFDLLEESKLGQGFTNRLYLKKVQTTIDKLDLYVEDFKEKVEIERKKERKRVNESRKKHAQPVAITLNGQNDRTRTEKMTVQERSKLPYSNTDFKDLDFSNTESVVVVEEKTDKLALIKKYNLKVSENQKMLVEKFDIKLLEEALDETIARGGKSFSYMYQVYKGLSKKTKGPKTKPVQTKQEKKPLTRFHNINDATKKYTPEELEALLKANQKRKFEKEQGKDQATPESPEDFVVTRDIYDSILRNPDSYTTYQKLKALEYANKNNYLFIPDCLTSLKN